MQATEQHGEMMRAFQNLGLSTEISPRKSSILGRPKKQA